MNNQSGRLCASSRNCSGWLAHIKDDDMSLARDKFITLASELGIHTRDGRFAQEIGVAYADNEWRTPDPPDDDLLRMASPPFLIESVDAIRQWFVCTHEVGDPVPLMVALDRINTIARWFELHVSMDTGAAIRCQLKLIDMCRTAMSTARHFWDTLKVRLKNSSLDIAHAVEQTEGDHAWSMELWEGDLHGHVEALTNMLDDLDANPDRRFVGTREEYKECTHSPDFASVRWYGVHLTFRAGQQAKAVNVLWQGWENGTPEVSQDEIKRQIGAADSFRMDKLFKDSPALGVMIHRENQLWKLDRPNKLSVPD